MPLPVFIVGGGISGLATAFYLKERGIRSTLVEESARLGGLILTDKVAGCELEGGPDSFIAIKPAVAQLAGELGIAHKLIGSNDSARQIFIVRNGALVPMPQGMQMMVPTKWRAALESNLFSPETKHAFLRERFSKPRQRSGDFSIRELVVDHFGEESLEYLTEPLLSGVYGGNASALSARSVLPRFVEWEEQFGSLIRGAQKSTPARKPGGGSFFQSFAGGMGTLVEALSDAIADSCTFLQAKVDFVNRDGMNAWNVGANGQTFAASHVVLACAAHQSARLIAQADPTLSALLGAIQYSSSTLVTLLFEQDQFTHALNGFGFLVPQPERHAIAAATWINTKFPSRVAPGKVALRAFLVDPEATQYDSLGDTQLVELVCKDLKRFMGFAVEPSYSRVYRWPCSMPQYVVGHAKHCSQIASQLEQNPGLHLVSNYLDGVGIPDCVRIASVTASKINVLS